LRTSRHFSIFFAFLLIGISFAGFASAHVLRVDGTIGVLLHIDPNDKPVAERDAHFILSIQDSTGRFDVTKCNCTVTIYYNEQRLDSYPFPVIVNKLLPIEYVFPRSGTYHIVVQGNPVNGGSFQPFRTEFVNYVQGSLSSGGEPDVNPLMSYIPYAVLAAALLLAAIFAVPMKKMKGGS
jgi:hypothetical protein